MRDSEVLEHSWDDIEGSITRLPIVMEMSMDSYDIEIFHELTWRCGSLKRYSLYAKSCGAWHS
jgi:hypothetical protein